MDVWGAIYRDHLDGRGHPHVIERDDGLRIESAAAYFEAPRSELEREYLDSLHGPVLDLGAGPGSHALYLQARGLTVTAVDSSEGAIDVCLQRGCKDARVMDLNALELDADQFSAIIVMGNTLGIHQTPATFPVLMRELAGAARTGARLLCVMRDPLDTDDPNHVRYHEHNRAAGQPPGMYIIRLRYRNLVDDWVRLWMPTRDEFLAALSGSGWSLVEEKALGPNRIRLLERSVAAV